MRTGGKYSTVSRVALIVWLASAPMLSVAQDSDAAGLTAELRFSQQLVDEDQGSFARSRADFTLSSVTAHSALELRLGGSYDLSLSGADGDDFDDPLVSLSYSQETRTQAFTFDASFRRTDIETSVLTATALGFQVVLDDGQTEDLNGSVSYSFGQGMPVGGSLEFRYAERNYIDTISPSLIDSTTVSVETRLDFQIHPKARARLTAFASELDRDGGTDVDTLRFGGGATVDLTSTLTGDFDLTYSRVTESGVTPDADREGITFDISLVETRQNGTLSGAISSQLNESSRLTSLSIGRELDLPAGNLSAQVGYSFDDNDNESPTFNLSYVHELPRGQFVLSAGQSFSSSSDGQELLNSQVSLRHSHEFTESANFNIGLSYSNSDFFSSLQNDSDQFDVNISFDQEITTTWSFIAGYSHTRRSSDNGTESTDDEIFIGLETTIGWRP